MSRGVQAIPLEESSRSILAAAGYSEIITYSFVDPADMADFAEDAGDERSQPVKMKNPLTEDASVLRTTIMPGLLHSLRTNINSGNKDLKIFETGKIYIPAEGEVLPEERTLVCAAATGLARPITWQGPSEQIGFFDLKGAAETLIESLCPGTMRTAGTSHKSFHPGMCADIYAGDELIGKMGEIHPGLLNKYEIDQKVFLFEIDLDAVSAALGAGLRADRKHEKFSRFPSAERDLAVVIDEDVEAAVVSGAIREAGGDILDNVLLFDIYRGKQVDEGKKSLAFSLRFQSHDRTLTDEEISAASDKIIKSLEKLFEAKLRA